MSAAFAVDSDFLDFHLIVSEIEGREDLGFVAAVAHAPAGRWDMRPLLIPGTEALQRHLESKAIEVELVRGALTARWRAGTGLPFESQSIDGGDILQRARREFQEALFTTLFPKNSGLYTLLRTSCEIANQLRRPIRMRLELPAQLANLPWESMRCPRNHPQRHWVDQARILVVRYLCEIEALIEDHAVADPATVLLIRAEPEEVKSPDLTQSFLNEWGRIKEVFRRHANRLTCETIEGEDTYGQLTSMVLNLVNAGRHIIGIHYIGHGGCDNEGGYLLTEGLSGASRRLYESDLRRALDTAQTLRWVFLNACTTGYTPVGCPLSGLGAGLSVIKNVPTVIAHTRPVVTTDAEEFGPEFYKLVLDNGLGIEEAVRHLLFRIDDSGGLVILARMVGSRMRAGMPLPAMRMTPMDLLHPLPSAGADRVAAASEEPQPARSPTPQAAGEAIRMLRIPPGHYRRGLTEKQVRSVLAQFSANGLAIDSESAARLLREEPLSERMVEAFRLSEAPVTNWQFKAFADATGWKTEAERNGAPETWRTQLAKRLGDHPVVFVTFDDAIEYCKWAGKRLPTADEWLKASRGPQGFVYPWGDEFDAGKCNTAESQHGWQTTPVGRFELGRSGYGCLDMVGNVEEWTASPDHGGRLIVLGGSWCMTCQVYGLPVTHRIASRTFYSNELGFRCAASAES